MRLAQCLSCDYESASFPLDLLENYSDALRILRMLETFSEALLQEDPDQNIRNDVSLFLK